MEPPPSGDCACAECIEFAEIKAKRTRIEKAVVAQLKEGWVADWPTRGDCFIEAEKHIKRWCIDPLSDEALRIRFAFTYGAWWHAKTTKE